MKKCRGCGQVKEVADFYRSGHSKDGLQARCKPCQEGARRVLVAARREAVKAAAGAATAKRCPRCTEEKPLDQFAKNQTQADGRQSYCRPCSTQVRKEWESRNAEAVALRQAEKLATPVSPTGVKTCTKCLETKPLLSFYAHRGTRDGRTTYCKECQKAATRAWNAANKERISKRNAAERAANPDKKKRDHRQFWLKLYGLDQAGYQALLEKQGGVCAICLLPERYVDARTGEARRLSVDHCHATGKVRGLLCGRCNRSIGQFADDHERLTRAAAYLREAAIGG